MRADLARQLVQLNKEFYSAHAAAFAASRSLAQPSLVRLLEFIRPNSRVLDIGCGHGRVAHLLDEQRPGVGYHGLDFSAEFIAHARRAAAELAHVQADFSIAELTDPGWPAVLADQQFDTILLLAVLHHIPAYRQRLELVRALKKLLAPAGRLIVSTWQFTSNERMRRKIVGWDRVGIDPAGLEPGDYLLDWKRGEIGYRYCHLVDEQELARLASESGFSLLETFRADGREGDLSLFGILVADEG